ncbi:MAG: metal-dependent hydrolase [Planctomycetota bacterium]|nr:metal-dependent hydrolase [Planctomycetota bacterium]
MDIVTHGMMGVIVASPFMPSYPIAASCFMMGSVLPDLDALSRVLGRRAFLKSHQTYTHAIPIILLMGGVCWAGFRWTGIRAPFAPAALVLGMLFHVALDVTNTYGITLFAPFSGRRFCLEWVFFIDAFVLAATLPTAVWVG